MFFKDIGGRIKAIAKIIFWVLLIIEVIAALMLAPFTWGLSTLILLIGLPIEYIFCCMLYGFGEIIDRLWAIERNTRKEKDE